MEAHGQKQVNFERKLGLQISTWENFLKQHSMEKSKKDMFNFMNATYVRSKSNTI